MQAKHQDDVLEVLKAMELMWMSIVLNHGADADEAYDALFGPEDWVGRLIAVGDRTTEFQSRFPGPVVKIDNFAVTSGHEAVAMFARRVAEWAPARAKWIPTHRTERESARAAGNETQARRAERDLREAIRDFAQFMEQPFNGWFENRAWIRRSVEQEIANPDGNKRDREKPVCIVRRISPSVVEVVEGGTSLRLSGPRRSWVMMQVVSAGRRVTWQELIEADVRNAGEIMDRRMKSRAASGTETPKNAVGSRHRGTSTPRMATEAKTLQNLGHRIRKDLGKLDYHWDQDGLGAVWNSDCQ